jgi:hypothetical protein
MQSLKLTGQEQYILLQALKNFEEKVNQYEFATNSIFTKEFIQNHVATLTAKIELMQKELQTS